MKYLASVIVAVGLLAGSAQAQLQRPLVIGGGALADRTHYEVAVLAGGLDVVCTATMIAPQWFLTAAHAGTTARRSASA